MSLESVGTGNNFDQFHCNSCLSGFIVSQAELVQHFTGILAGVLHGLHTSALFRGSVLEKSVIQSSSNVQLIVVVLGEILIWFLGIVSNDILELLQEVGSIHDFKSSWDGGDDGLEFVINEDNVITIFCGSSEGNLVGEGSSDGEVHWVKAFTDRGVKAIRERSDEGSSSLFSDNENFVGGSVGSDELLDFSDDGRVNTTAQTFVGGNWDNKTLLDWELEVFLLEITFVGQDVLDVGDTESFAGFESVKIQSHFGSSHHLHGLGDLLDRSD